MATSTCVKCGSSRFELQPAEPANSRFKLYFVQCSSCGGVVGVQEFNNATAMLDKQNAAIKKIAQKVGAYVDL